MLKNTILSIYAIFLISCGDIIDHSTTLNEHYFVDAINGDESRSLYYDLESGGGGVGRVSMGVVAVGWNNTHIIVKQHIDNLDGYYILDMKKDSKYADPKDSVFGPYRIDEFTAAKNKYGVEDNLTFSLTF